MNKNLLTFTLESFLEHQCERICYGFPLEIRNCSLAGLHSNQPEFKAESLEENFASSGYLGNKRRVNYPTWKEEDKKTQFADQEPRKATSHSISVFFEEFSLNLKN